MYSSMAKGTSQAKVTSNSEKIKPVALAIAELRKSEGIVILSVLNIYIYIFINFVATF